MRLLSVNVGSPRDNPWKPVGLTGIDKRPVSGPVQVTAPGPKGTGAVGLAGDRVLLEVCCPRLPCGTFQGWLGRAGWIRQFTEAARPGAYLRVTAPGRIRAGDPVVSEHRPAHAVTVA